ncbi:MAG TPA: MmgE/PrpD family protein [Chloroflexota bacterium]|nr:MmgE/PrpD family protein [Chloroflexota bacterium]
MTTELVRESSTTAAARLAAVWADLGWDSLPTDVQDRTRELLLDLLGVALGGSRQPSSPPAAEVARRLGGDGGQASVVGAGFATTAVWAALANGTAAHAIELDDVTTESSLHPGVAVIPTAFALAEELGAPPSALLEAVVAGYEVTMRVGNALNPASAYARGFHPTGVAGVFGAAMAAGRLLRLGANRLEHALGIAGTLASGSLEYLSDGAWTKRLNPGWAGHAGITAAYLADARFSGPRTALEGPLGVLHAYSDDPRPERLLADLDGLPQIMRVSVKPYACCRYNHGLIDCVLELRRAHQIQPEQVERVRLGVLSGGALLVADPIEQKRTPRSVVDAQFSAPYAAAAALVLGTGGLDAYGADRLDDPRIRRLLERTDCYRDSSLDAEYPLRWPAAAEIELRDGRRVSTRIEFATGEPENPVPRAGLVDKFVSLATPSVPDARGLAQRILAIDGEPDLRTIGSALRGRG